jgi:hypothetical protein
MRSGISFRPAPVVPGVLVGCFVGLLAAGGLSAQSTSSNAAPVCMARTASDGSVLNIITPATDVEGLRKKGFASVSCNNAFATNEQREEWKEAICTIASTTTLGEPDSFEAQMGERPNVLCGMAELAVSQWRRGRPAGE